MSDLPTEPVPLSPAVRGRHARVADEVAALRAAKVARHDRQVLALSGDGGLQFTVQELATAVQRQLPLPIVVFDNGSYGSYGSYGRIHDGIHDGMAARGDTPTAVDLPPVDLPALARAYGGHGTRACSPEKLRRTLTESLDTPGPTLITIREEIA